MKKAKRNRLSAALHEFWRGPINNPNNNPEKMKNTDLATQDISTNGVADIIHVTSDYDKFELNDWNRDIIDTQIKDLKKSMTEEGFWKASPLIARLNAETGKYTILDGQHRLLAARDLEIPVRYIVVDYDDHYVSRSNRTHRKWTSADQLKFYCSKGYPEYMKFREFIRRYEISVSDGIYFACKTQKTQTKKEFDVGTFVFRDQPHAEYVAQCWKSFEPFFPSYRINCFKYAVARICRHPEYVHKTMMQKVARQSEQLRKQVNTADYVKMLEKVYNNQNRKKVRFI